MIIIGNRYCVITECESKSEISKVYIAKDLKCNKNAIALKVLMLGEKSDEIVNELFRREISSLQRLSHDNIIEYLDSGNDENKLYISTEFFDGKNLDDYINENKLNEQEKLSIICQIIEGLAHAHEKGVIHRDLKPTNIMVDMSHKVKLIDFGISKIIGLKYDSDKTVKDYMSIQYAAPEQLMRYEVDPQSDIYSLGLVILYILSEIQPPTNRNEISQYIQNVACSDSIKKLLYLMLEDDRNNRPKSIHEVKRVFRNEYISSISKNKTIYVMFKANIKRQLYSLGLINYTQSDSHSKSFIENDLKISYLYKYKNAYILVGNKVKYICKYNSDQPYLFIEKISYMDDQIMYEKEMNRGFNVHIPWNVITQKQSGQNGDDLSEILEQATNEEMIRIEKNRREKIQNDLLNKWENFLQEEFRLVDDKKKLCKYSDFEIDDSGYKLNIEVDGLELPIEKGETIQITGKNGNQTTIGQYEEILDHKIIVNLNADVIIEELSKKGNLGIDIVQARESLKRLMKALKVIKSGDTVNSNLPHILGDPSIIRMNSVTPINEFFQSQLNESKRNPNIKAIEKALSTRDIFLIQGPPGTGKTTVITEIVCQILKENPQAKILLSSQSHVAVDHAINKISELLPDKRIIRIGRSEKISSNSQNLMLSTQLDKWVSSVKQRSNEGLINFLNNKYILNEDETNLISEILNSKGLLDEKRILNTDGQNDEKANKINSISIVVKEWHRRLGKIDEFDEIFADKASIVAATCLGIASRHVLSETNFDWVIVDEAARATPLELLVPLVRGKKIILVGDHRQLPPVVSSNMSDKDLLDAGIKTSDLEKSLFEELFDNMSDSSKIVLTNQFRMHPSISKLIGDIFYPTEKISTNITEEERKHPFPFWPRSICWIDTIKMKDCFEQDYLTSKRNQAEARIIYNKLEELAYISNGNEVTVGVISGYEAQKNLLSTLIKPNDRDKWKSLKIIIDNVDAFQGSETDIVFYSVVRCNNENKIGFLHDERRLNVALSRGKCCLFIIGNMKFANTAKSFMGNPFKDVIKFFKMNESSCYVEVYNEHY